MSRIEVKSEDVQTFLVTAPLVKSSFKLGKSCPGI